MKRYGLIIVVVAIVGAAAAVATHKGKYDHGSKAFKSLAAYCPTVKVGHTVILNTEGALGDPDSKVTMTTDGVKLLYLAYGPATFTFDPGSTRLFDVSGCPAATSS